ncbi:MAG: hypothetical protein K2K24_03535, partial [Clostridia bacterium]|nr:hypothetical protein [Clostridia bacterium]
GADGEVTKNDLNLVSYSLFTKISANRGIGSFGGQGLGGWNSYTSATWTLNRVNNGAITSTNGLAIYATLLHNFGQDAYIKARGARGSAYLDKWANYTHQDMTYYASVVRDYGFQGGGNYSPSQAVKNANYPLFVPVASVYQTGRSYMYDNVKRDIKTMQPFVIPFGYNYTVDLRKYDAPGGQYASGSIIIGNGFSFKIKGVTQPENGQLVETDTPGVYTYVPDPNSKSLRSGQIRVTLEITADETTDIGAKYKDKIINDVDLILEFELSHETSKMKLERTTYTYEASKMYADSEEAYSKGFAGYSSVNKMDHSNPTQNANTDIWFLPNTESNVNKYQTHPEYIIKDNQIDVLDGKLYCEDDGKYRIYLRGRTNCALYFSLNGTDYYLGAKITKDTPIVSGGTNAQFRSDSSTFFDVQFAEGNATATVNVNGRKIYNYTISLKEGKQEIENWIYIREVLIDSTANSRSYIGVGSTKWSEEM